MKGLKESQFHRYATKALKYKAVNVKLYVLLRIP